MSTSYKAQRDINNVTQILATGGGPVHVGNDIHIDRSTINVDTNASESEDESDLSEGDDGSSVESEDEPATRPQPSQRNSGTGNTTEKKNQSDFQDDGNRAKGPNTQRKDGNTSDTRSSTASSSVEEISVRENVVPNGKREVEINSQDVQEVNREGVVAATNDGGTIVPAVAAQVAAPATEREQKRGLMQLVVDFTNGSLSRIHVEASYTHAAIGVALFAIAAAIAKRYFP